MKWLSKWIYKKWSEGRNNEERVELVRAPDSISSSSSIDSRGMNFTVYRANGGHVIEHRIYDRKTDRHNNSLHIVTDDRDLGEEIGKIITYENLRS